MTVKFVKQINGGWAFQVRTASGMTRAFSAWRNEAGFAGREWELHGFDKEIDDWYVIEDGFESRAAVVEWARGMAQ